MICCPLCLSEVGRSQSAMGTMIYCACKRLVHGSWSGGYWILTQQQGSTSYIELEGDDLFDCWDADGVRHRRPVPVQEREAFVKGYVNSIITAEVMTS